jgi:hypothetical protein
MTYVHLFRRHIFRQRCDTCRNQAITPTTTLEIPRRLFHWVVGVMAFNANYDY